MNLPDFLAAADLGFVHLAGSRVGLHHVVRAYNEGRSPEGIAEDFPTLPLATVHRCIAFYLDHRQEVDDYARRHDAEVERAAAVASKGPGIGELRRRLAAVGRRRDS